MDERDKDFASRKCARCGADLQGVAGSELCPKCLLEAGLETQPVQGPTGTAVRSASEQSSPGLPQPGEQLGHYRIIRILGQGGMGAAFEAEDLETGRRVALKVLGHTLDSPNARDRFFREGRLAASINHPNSVYVFGTEEIAGTPVIAMELVPGGTLQQRVDAAGPLPASQAVDYMLQVIAGLEAAQRIGILHRDVKPSNCFIDTDGTVKIGDFGLSISTAVRTEPALTATGIFLGTPAFCSPEQLRGDELNARSDIYSVGATLFYLLTGRTPFEGKDMVQLLATVLEQPVPSPKKFRADIPGGLANVIMRCLEKQPGERFKNYQELTHALAPYRTEAPTPATLGLRFLAGVLDTQILTVTGVIIQFLVFGSLTAAADVMLSGRSGIFMAIAVGFGVGVLYYGVQEGIWGATLGKRICRLRVVTPDKGPPGFGLGLVRALIYSGVPAAPSWIAYIFFKGSPLIGLTGSRASSTVIGLSFYVLLALLFCTARRRNGFAAIHDLLTDTRVIARAPFPVRPPLEVSETAPADVETKPTVGPYHIIDVLSKVGDVQWLLGYDLHLLRKVWLRVVPPGTPSVPLTLRNISRAGRLRWLTGRRSPEENWDAFEGISGQPFVNLVLTPQSWSRVRYWLHDLAGEISAAENDGTLPAHLSLEQVWITGDGRAKLLDFPAPGLSNLPASGRSALPIRTGGGSPEQSRKFLSHVAAAALAGDISATVPGDAPVPLPLHARDFLRSLPELPDAETIVAALRPLLSRIAAVSRARRAAVVGGCIALPLFLGVSSLVGLSLVDKWQRDYPGLMELNSLLQQRSTLRFLGTHSRTPSDRQYSIFIATHYRSLITNQVAWSSPVAQIMIKGDARKFAEQSVASNLSPNEKEIAEVEVAFKPYASVTQPVEYSKHSFIPFAVVYGMLFCYVVIPAMIAALLFRGGLVLRVANVAFVRRDGVRASRLRVFWRALVAWSPLLLALIFFVMLFPISATTATVTPFAIVVLLTLLSLALPERSLPDRFAGTWPVPRRTASCLGSCCPNALAANAIFLFLICLNRIASLSIGPMLARVCAAAVNGIEAFSVEVEVDSGWGDTIIVIVGLPDAAVKESRDRVTTALSNSGFRFPMGKTTINLAPADVKKEGPSFDLPIAIGMLAASEQVESDQLDNFVIVGELALTGAVRPCKGVLPIAIRARQDGMAGLLVPADNAPEAAVVSGLQVIPIQNLREAASFLEGEIKIAPTKVDVARMFDQNHDDDIDFAEVKGQESVKRALEIAAAGGHNVLLIGPPGTGKSMLAKRLATILPPLTLDEALETTKIHSIVGLLAPGQALVTRRPFRSPHHTASDAGLLGGNINPTPGEISLAHHGVLFLDELPEFKRGVLETMRQPLEEGHVTISRAAGTMTFPSQFMLVAAMNPTPDGKMPHESHSSPREIQNYLGRISGPLLDRVDLHIEVPQVKFREITSDQTGETSAQIRERVVTARRRQQERFKAKPKITCNARMGSRELKAHCTLDEATMETLKFAMTDLNLSARAYDRILKVARTIADLAGAEKIATDHVSEAIQYRSLDRQLWV